MLSKQYTVRYGYGAMLLYPSLEQSMLYGTSIRHYCHIYTSKSMLNEPFFVLS